MQELLRWLYRTVVRYTTAAGIYGQIITMILLVENKEIKTSD